MYFNYYSVITIQIFIIFIFSYAFNITAVFTMHLVYAIWMCVCVCGVCCLYDGCMWYILCIFVFYSYKISTYCLSWAGETARGIVSSLHFSLLFFTGIVIISACEWINEWVSLWMSVCVSECCVNGAWLYALLICFSR